MEGSTYATFGLHTLWVERPFCPEILSTSKQVGIELEIVGAELEIELGIVEFEDVVGEEKAVPGDKLEIVETRRIVCEMSGSGSASFISTDSHGSVDPCRSC